MGTGAVIEQHPLVAYQSNGTVHGLTLMYDSERADPRPIIHFGMVSGTQGNNIPTGDDKERLVASLSVQNGSFVYQAPGYTGNLPGLSGGEHFWTFSQADRVDAALQADLRSFPSGIYQYTINTGFLRGDATGFTGSLTDTHSQVISVNTIDSPFGAGWGIAGLQNIVVSDRGDVLLIDGDGSQLRFLSGYQSPPGDFTKLERVNGLFRRTTPDRTVYQFNADNQLATITVRNGNVTTYQYTGGRLVGMTDSVGLTTTLAYTGSRVSSITDPAGRITTLVYDAQGNLTSITDPDGALRTYGYDADHHKVSETDPLGRQDQTSYGFHGRAIGGVRYDGSRIQVQPLQAQDLYPPERTSDPLNAPATLVSNTNVSYADSNGNVTVTQLDKFGQTVFQTDRLGLLPVVSRDANNLPTSMIDARGNGTLQTYDARGNLLSQRDSLSGGGDIVGAISPQGETDYYSFTGHAGQRLYLDIPYSVRRGSANFWIKISDSTGQYLYSYQTEYGAQVNGSNGYNLFVLPHDDTYSVSISINPTIGRPATIGTYDFQLIDVDSVPLLPLDQPVAGRSASTQLYPLQGTAGQTVTITDLSGDSKNQTASWYFLDGQANRLGYGSFYSGSMSFLLPATGRYTLAMEPYSVTDSPLRFKFQATLADPPAVTKSGLGVDYTGIYHSGDPASFPFTAPAGTVVDVNLFGVDVNLDYRWFFQNTTTGTYYGNLHKIERFVVPISGNYLLYLGSNQYGAPYSFRLIDMTAAPLVTLGSTVSGTLTENSRLVAYRFQGQAGQQIDFGPPQTNVTRQLWNPNDFDDKGLSGHTFPLDASNVVTLASTAEYTVVERQNGTGAPTSFSFSLFDVSAATTAPLNTPINGQLLPGGGRQYFRFDAKNGDKLYLDDLGSSDKVHLRIQQLVVNGSYPYYPGYLDNSLPLAKHAGVIDTQSNSFFFNYTGSYLIVLDADEADRPASYNFQLDTAQTKSIPLALGQTVQGTFGGPLETDTYTFQGATGQQVYLNWFSSDTLLRNLSLKLIGPGGQELRNADVYRFYSTSLFVMLPQTGRYQLQVGNSNLHNRDNYSFKLLDVAAATSLTPGISQTGTLDSSTQVNYYKAHFLAGQRFTLNLVNSNAITFLYLPNGEEFNSISGSGTVTVPVAVSGDYTFGIRTGYGGTGSASYSVEVDDVSDASVTPVGLDQVYTGTGDGTEQTLGTFTGNAGTLMFFDYRTNFVGRVDVVGTAGNLSTTANVYGGFFTLPRSDTYTVKLTTTGSFSFRLRPASAAPLITLDANTTGTMSATNLSDLYRFNVAPGQILQLDRTHDTQQPISYTLSLPSGRATNETLSTFSGYQHSFSIAGIFYLLVTRPTAGTYSFQIHDLNAGTIIALGDVVSGAATPPSQAIIRHFSATAGQQLYSTTTRGNWTIFDPTNSPTNGIFNIPNTFTAPATGIYTVERDDDSASAIATFDFSISAVGEPVGTINPVYAPSAATVYTYDPTFNQMTSVTDDLRHMTLFDIDPANGNVRSATSVVGDVGGADDLTTLFTYLPSGLVDTVTDPLGRVTDYDYDALGRLITLTTARGTPLQTTRRFEHDVAGNVTAQIDENGHRTEFSYDAMGRLIQVTATDPDGAGPLSSPMIKLTYDAAGNRIATTDPLGHKSTTEYDALDRVRSQTDPGNNTTAYAYDQAGNLIRITDPLGHVTEYRYDARNRRTASVDPSGLLTSYGYDGDANLISVTDADGNKTSFEYDARNRLTRQIDPLGKATLYTYDAANNLRTKTDRLGRTSELTYDELDRLVQELWRNTDKTIANTVVNSFDQASQLLHSQDLFSSVSYVWDVLARPIQINTDGPNGIPTTSLAYSFDSVGNELSVVDTIHGQAGGTNAYSYDGLDRTTRIDQSGVGIASKRVDMQYNSLGQMTSLARYADVLGQATVANSTFAYDTLSRLSGISHKNAANSVLDSFVYQYDAASRITQITDIDGVTNYAYDICDELTAATHPASSNLNETYAYDPTGNRISSSRHGSGYTTGDGPAGAADANRLTSDGTYRYAYDAEGNLITRTQIAGGAVREFTWDHRNRLITVTDRPSTVGAPTQVVDYIYDTLNRRIASKVDTTPGDAVDGRVTYFVYDGSDVLVELVDLDGSGPAVATESMRYLHGPAVDQIFAQENAAGDVLWDLTDHLGTVRDLVNNNGVVVNHLKYDSYGNLVAESNPAVHTRYQFTGREHDAETGMQYNRARYYEATVGRFLSEDPIGMGSGDTNDYRYVSNSPVRNLDPLGLEGKVAGSAYSFLTDWRDKARKIGEHLGDLSTLPGKLMDQIRNRRNDTPIIPIDKEPIDLNSGNAHEALRNAQKVTCAIQTAGETAADNSAIGTAKGAFDFAKPLRDFLTHPSRKRKLEAEIDKNRRAANLARGAATGRYE